MHRLPLLKRLVFYDINTYIYYTLKNKKMKNLIFTLFMALVFGAVSQNTAKQLQSNKWFVKGAFDGKTLILTNAADPASTWEAKFSSTGQLHNCSTTKNSVIDPTGVEIKTGTYYCDSLYAYKVKGNVISISYMPTEYYYKIKALPNNAGYELSPATKADFK
jgi:hypothetical protein